ncbi:guanine nucleotide binding protein, alpha subunit [Mycena vitilis]|nr:guanine nucleotide binding protein, alpha subunit [Mycena vitilis]
MRSTDVDPIAAALAPASDESSEDREKRIISERAAKQVSDEIDDQLNRERQLAKSQVKPVKILLLGQSESGKSTTLKNFQLMYDPKAFRAERASWRAIIQLNVIRSIRIILDAMTPACAGGDPPSPHSSYSSQDSLRIDADLLGIRMRLHCLGGIEDRLACRLAATDDNSIRDLSSRTATLRRRTGAELALNSTVAWKSSFMGDSEPGDGTHWENPNVDDPGVLLQERAEDMRRLWAHPTIHALLESKGIRLQEAAGFFLDELDLVISPNYIPTDDHILRARLKTLGVSEHRMQLSDPSGGAVREFRIFDVGGERVQRPKWIPYFDDMSCIIFLAPISAFDQKLDEEPGINRLADSFELWKRIASSKLLQKTSLILFLNKVDILRAKLKSGIQFTDYVASYGRRPNDFDSASRYMEKKFRGILKDVSPVPRMFYCHLTNAIDAKATRFVLAGIKDRLIRSNLTDSLLI